MIIVYHHIFNTEYEKHRQRQIYSYSEQRPILTDIESSSSPLFNFEPSQYQACTTIYIILLNKLDLSPSSCCSTMYYSHSHTIISRPVDLGDASSPRTYVYQGRYTGSFLRLANQVHVDNSWLEHQDSSSISFIFSYL